MESRKRHIIAAIMLVIVLAPLSYSVIFRIRQNWVQHEMKERLENSLLQEIVVPAASLQWIKPGKEILVDQQLFDIKSIRYDQNGNALIRGLFDEKETLLIKQLRKDVDQQNSKGSRQNISLFKTIQSLPEYTAFNFSAPVRLTDPASIPGAGDLPAACLRILTPPPQC